METYMTIEELADYLKIAENTIRKWVLHRNIPFHKILKAVRFRVSEIEKWINDGCYSSLTDADGVVEGDLLDVAVSLEELAEKELAETEAEDFGGGE